METTSRNLMCCHVYGCLINSQKYPKASFFPLTKDPQRRTYWLKIMHRRELADTAEEIFICNNHFSVDDVIEAPNGNILKKNADPTLNMPVAITGEAGVQAQPWLFDSFTQTENNKPITSHMILQVGPSLMAELRKKRRLQDDYELVTTRLKMFESGDTKFLCQLFRATCDNFLTGKVKELVESIIDNVEGHPYNLAYKVFCLNLYHASPQAYQLLSEYFSFPSINKLKQIDLPLSTKIDEDIMRTFKIKINHMTETEKYCSVVIDVIKLKYNLFYSANQDKVIGFHEIDGLQSPVPARYAIVMVVRGILINWTQPITFALVSATKCREIREEISRWITKMLSKLLEMGLNVKTLVCSAKTELLNEANIRLVTIDKPYFFINEVKIFYVYDFPHMFRMLRNHFMTHDFIFGSVKKRVAKFDYVKEFYERDKTRKLRIAHGLTDSHINPSAEEKRDTKFAIDLLSKTVAVGIETFINFKVMHEFAADTVEFLVMMDDLQEILNSTALSLQYTYRGNQNQINILNTALKFFKSLKLVNSATEEEITTNFLFVKGIQFTIQSVLQLFEELQQKQFKYLLTGRLNQSVTENLFKTIKSKGDKSIIPTSQRFILKFRRQFFASMIKPMNEGGISEDFGLAIAKLNELSESKSNMERPKETASETEVSGPSNSSYRMCDNVNIECHVKNLSESYIEEHFQLDAKVLQEIAKCAAESNSHKFVQILLKKCIEFHDCQMLKYFLVSYEIDYNLTENDNQDQYAIVKTELIPDNELFLYIAHMEEMFRKVFDNCLAGQNLVSTIYTSFKSNIFLNTYAPCPCFPVELFQKLFIRVRLYATVNYNNATFRKTGDSEKTFSIPIL